MDMQDYPLGAAAKKSHGWLRFPRGGPKAAEKEAYRPDGGDPEAANVTFHGMQGKACGQSNPVP